MKERNNLFTFIGIMQILNRKTTEKNTSHPIKCLRKFPCSSFPFQNIMLKMPLEQKCQLSLALYAKELNDSDEY